MKLAFDRFRDRDDPSIAELWRGTLSAGLHGSGCACGVGMVSLSAADLEEDLLDFLSDRYPAERAPALAAALAARRHDRTTSFPIWMGALRSTLGSGDWAALEQDVRSVLNSATAPGSGFICA